MCFFYWRDCLNKHTKAASFMLLAAFAAGVALLLLPVATELAAYRIDENEYVEMAQHYRLPSPSPTAFPLTPVTDAEMTDASLASPLPDTPLPAGTPSGSFVPLLQAGDTPAVSPCATSSPFAGALQTSGLDLFACRAQNEDFAAWLTIPGTVVSYPVVRSDDTAYYLNHLFTGKKSKLGCLFSLTTSDYEKPSQNIAIYGHHLSQGNAMFSSLIEYKDAAYYAEHSTVTLDGFFGRRSYRIFAVLNMKVSEWDPSTATFHSSQAFLGFVNRAREKALYSTGVEVEADDQLLTLITCDRSYGGVSGRLIVMAVQEPY